MAFRRHQWGRALVIGAALSLAGSSSGDTNQTIPAPIVVPASQYFEGNDGPWSTLNLRVGTPEQDVRVLVSTAAPQTLVVLSSYGCSTNVLPTVPLDCAISRGALFNNDTSSTWDTIGVYGFNGGSAVLEANLGYSTKVLYGHDTLGLGYTSGSSGPRLESQVVGGVITAWPFYLGIFGLNNQPLNFSVLGNSSSPTFISLLYAQDLIPSLSWSYTAGANYRFKAGASSQVILGGYDTSKYISNSVVFSFVDDITRDIVVYLQSISYTGQTTSILYNKPIPMFIDSTDPNIWLPEEACQQFEKAFNLTLDTFTNMYLISDSHHATLMEQNAQVTFQIADSAQGGETARIVLPYAAFGRVAKYPLVANGSSYYFPLQIAANASQYTLGRTFLQEAYLTVDYERKKFNVSQVLWNEGAEPHIVPIFSKSDTTNTTDATSLSTPSSNSSSSLPPGPIAGIVVGICALFAIILILYCVLYKRRRQSARRRSTRITEFFGKRHSRHGSAPDGMDINDLPTKFPLASPPELMAEEKPQELEGEDLRGRLRELDGKAARDSCPVVTVAGLFEMDGAGVVPELGEEARGFGGFPGPESGRGYGMMGSEIDDLYSIGSAEISAATTPVATTPASVSVSLSPLEGVDQRNPLSRGGSRLARMLEERKERGNVDGV